MKELKWRGNSEAEFFNPHEVCLNVININEFHFEVHSLTV